MTVREFMSPGYPNLYDNNIHKTTPVELTDSSRTGFKIEIVDYQIEKAPTEGNGCYDYFMIEPLSTVNGDDISLLTIDANDITKSFLNSQICGEIGDGGVLRVDSDLK